MPSPAFIRLHSEYSITDGMPALALTDLNSLFGMVKFYKAARGKGVKPLIGCDVWIENEANRDQPGRLLLLCQNRKGYGNLCELLTQAFRGNQYRGRAEIRKEWLAGMNEGLIALSGAHLGDIGQAILNGNQAQASQLAREWDGIFSQRFYLSHMDRLDKSCIQP